MKGSIRVLSVILLVLALVQLSACSGAPAATDDASPGIPDEAATTAPPPLELPQIDCSTARIPITDAIYRLFTEKGYTGPEPMSSKTHGAWVNLSDGAADIVFLVAPTAEELELLTQKGVDIDMKVYGYDGLVFMGHGDNPVGDLSSDQIRSIFSGKITNWEDLGGIDTDLVAYVRNPESGSQRLFESLVWDGYDMPDYAAMFTEEGYTDPAVRPSSLWVSDGMEDVTVAVMDQPNAIAYNIMSYLDSTFSDANLRLFSVDGFAPTPETFASGDYPFLTTSYVVIRADEPSDSPARQLFNWVGSSESRDLIAENSTLSVSFSQPVRVRTGVSAPEDNAELAALIPTLNQQTLQREDLFPFTLEETDYLRNGIFALSGLIFENERYAAYFQAQEWYQATETADSEVAKRFTKDQVDNLQLILSYQKDLKRALANR